MAIQMKYIFPIFIIVALYSSSSSCDGRIIQLVVTRGKHNNNQSYVADDMGVQKCHGEHVLKHRKRRSSAQKTYSVDNYGAKGDGRTDDSKAFVKAWKKACSSSNSVFVVPSNKKYLLKPTTFSGPCKSAITIKISGTILASKDRSVYKKDVRHWLVFEKIKNLYVENDGGIIDGQGKIWWGNSCKVDKKLPCTHAPTAVTFYSCNNLVVKNLKVINGQQMNLSFQKCNHVKASGLIVTCPGDSPNTDGIHITETQNIELTKCTIGTGDDCISIENGSNTIRAKDITCGPGHGISIGSLGDHQSEAHVSDIIVNGATLKDTTNGLRIKTWQGGSGYARNIIFENIMLSNVDNPIIIDQQYCDQDEPCKKQSSAVQVRDVMYKNIKGTSSSKKAVVFDCSNAYPCKGITMENVQIKNTNKDKPAEATCNNVQISNVGNVSPKC